MKHLFFLLLSFFIIGNINATIIHTDLSPDSLVLMTVDPTFGTGSGSGLASLDINNDGTIDFDFRYNVSPGFGWFLHISEKNSNKVIKTTYNSSTLTSNPYAFVVDTNSYIGVLSEWSSSEEPLIGDTTDYNFGGQGVKYIGVELDIAGNTHYGWIKVSFDNTIYPKTLTILEYAYRDVADVPIASGQATGPPPIPEIELSLFDTVNYTISGDTINFGTVNLSTNENRILKVKNTGTTDLVLSDFLISTGNTADFSISLPSDTIVHPNDSVNFTVTFSPNVAGPRQSLLSFNTNDSDESSFSIVLFGFGGSGGGGGTMGDLVVKLAGVVYNDASMPYDFGTITVGNPVTEIFKIYNTGTSDIDIMDLNFGGFGGTSEFSSTLSAPLIINAGDSVDFPITYNPTTNGIHNGNAFIMFGMGEFYSFQLSGQATGGSDPTGLFLVKNGNVIPNFNNYDLGNIPLGSTFTEDFYIRNTGTTSIDIENIDFGSFGGGSSNFSSTVTAPFSISAGDSILFPISFSPQFLGLDNTFLSIEPDFMSGIDPIQISLSGTGVDAILVTAIDIYGQGNVSTIDVNLGTLQILADLLPTTATNQNVTWSVDDNTIATISSTGVLQAVSNGSVIVTATTTDGSNLSDDVTIEISNQTTGVNDLDENAIVIYPTEVNDKLYFKIENSNLRNSKLFIYNILGKEVLNISSIPNEISLNELSRGVYFVKVVTINNKTLTKKFLKK